MFETIDKRPLLWLAIAFAFGLTFRIAPWGPIFAVPLFFFVSNWGRRGLVFGVIGLGMLLSPSPAKPITASAQPMEVEVMSVPRLVPGSQSQALVSSDYGLLRLRSPAGVSLSLGERWRVEATPVKPMGDESWRRRGVRGNLSPKAMTKIGDGPFWFRWGVSWRESFQRFTSQLHPEQAATLDALCFNADAALSPDLKEDLKRAGAIHIISASGLHVTLFALALQFAFAKIPVPRLVQILLLLFILGLYAGAAGLRPPVFRAVAMAGLALPAYLWRREPDTLSALGAATLIQLAFDQTAIWDLGFQLSYALVFILGLYPAFETERTPLAMVRQSARISLVATGAATPLTAYYFSYVSLVGAPSNLLIAPLLLPLMVASLLGWLVWLVWPTGSRIFIEIAGWLADGVVVIAEAFGSLSFAAFEVANFSPWWILAAYAAALLMWRPSLRPPPQPAD